MRSLIILIGLLLLVSSPIAARVSTFWPQPKTVNQQGNNTWIVSGPSQIQFNIVKQNSSQIVPPYITDLISFYKQKIFQTPQPIPEATADAPQHENEEQNFTERIHRLRMGQVQNVLNIHIEDWTLRFSYDDAYTLDMLSFDTWDLYSQNYVGFVRGLETFSQTISHENGTFKLINMPLSISDQAAFKYRGVMIDTSRHFIPVNILLQNLDAMMYNKMNSFHWHITDDDSFPLQVKSYPDLANNTAFAEGLTYSQQDVIDVINYGLRRGVQVIPEIDTPAHTYSWKNTPQLENIIILCSPPTSGQFDPTLNETYTAVYNIFDQVNSEFPSNLIHFGGDEASNLCWNLRPSIKQFMDANNISSYQDLQIYYRNRQKSIFRNQIKSNKTIIYWANEQLNLPVQKDDIIQWWGSQSNIEASLKNQSSQIIVSSQDVLYLDHGFGRPSGNKDFFQYSTWRDIYTNFQTSGYGSVQDRILGAEACMWSELNNANTTLNKIWIRSSALAERLWNPNANSTQHFNNSINLVTRLVGQQRRMNVRGIQTIPVTDELCANDPSICYQKH